MTDDRYGEYSDPRGFLSKHGLRPKDSFGQCFLIAPPIAKAIVEALAPTRDETVVEIGTGCGTLARMLGPTARKVLAIERDRELLVALRRDPPPPGVEWLEADAGTWDYAAQCAAEPSVIVGNLPYQITGRLLRAILTPPVRWRCAVVMVQREVAHRLSAEPGSDDWGILGVFTQAVCAVERVIEASPGCFHPRPSVTSTVVRLTPRAKPVFEEGPRVQALVHGIFSARRKTLQNGLSGVLGLGRQGALEVLQAAGIEPRRRPGTLSLEELAGLDQALREKLHPSS